MTDVWDEQCFVTLTPIGGSNVEFAIRTRNIKFDNGMKDMEGMPLNNGGRAVASKPEEDAEWSFEDCYFVGIEVTDSDVSIAQFFEDGVSTLDTADPFSSVATHKRQKFRCVVMWTDAPIGSSAGQVDSACDEIPAGYNGYRVLCKEARIVEFKESWEDGLLKANFKLKFAPFDIEADANRKRESTRGAGLSAVSTYTTSTTFNA